MKVRIGYGLGTAAGGGGQQHFLDLVDGLERHRFDSLWLSERITGVAPDPVVGLAVAAGRTERLKLGSTCSPVAACCQPSASAWPSRTSNRPSASGEKSARPGSTKRCRSSAACGPRTPSITKDPASPTPG